MKVELKLACALFSWLVVSAATAQQVGTVVNMMGAEPRSAPRGCELITFASSRLESQMSRNGGEDELDSYYWFGCPLARRPEMVVLWRVRENQQLAGEMRLSKAAMRNAWYRLSSGERHIGFVAGSCVRKSSPTKRINAAVPVGYEAGETVPVHRTIVSWTVNDKKSRLDPVKPSELKHCEAG